MTVDEFKEVLRVAATNGGLTEAQVTLDAIDKLGDFSWHCLVNALNGVGPTC